MRDNWIFLPHSGTPPVGSLRSTDKTLNLIFASRVEDIKGFKSNVILIAKPVVNVPTLTCHASSPTQRCAHVFSSDGFF